MSRAKTTAGKDRWASTCEFHDFWQKHVATGWPNMYEAVLHAWKESAMRTRKRLSPGKPAEQGK